MGKIFRKDEASWLISAIRVKLDNLNLYASSEEIRNYYDTYVKLLNKTGLIRRNTYFNNVVDSVHGDHGIDYVLALGRDVCIFNFALSKKSSVKIDRRGDVLIDGEEINKEDYFSYMRDELKKGVRLTTNSEVVPLKNSDEFEEDEKPLPSIDEEYYQ